MRSPAAAIAWQFRQSHRWGLRALLIYFIALAAIRLFAPPVRFHDAESFAAIVVIPLTATFCYFLAVFSFGLSGDIASRDSMYPARMFTLPVTTSALAGWPMLYGTAAMALLWLATRFLGIWPREFAIPKWWPALLAASLLAWTQAMTWMPYPVRGLRVAVTVLWLATIDAIVLLALQFQPRESTMLALLAPNLPLAYAAARYALGRARRGDVREAQPVLADGGSRPRKAFASPARAQLWFEWRQHGRSLPVLVAIVLPCELALLFLFHETPSIVLAIVFGALLTPPFMAIFVAATIRNVDRFFMRRPFSNASLVAAKLQSAMWSVAASWLVVLIAIPVALEWSGAAPIVIGRSQRLAEILGTPRAFAIVALGLAVLIASTWKQLVQSLYIGMSGREWLIKGSVFGALSILAVAGPVAHAIVTNRKALAFAWNAFPWILAVLVCGKVAAAAWIAWRSAGERLVSDRALVAGAILWDVAVFAVYALLAWIFPALLVRRYFLALIAILAVPLARVSAAPLALSWSRHR